MQEKQKFEIRTDVEKSINTQSLTALKTKKFIANEINILTFYVHPQVEFIIH